MSKTSKLPVLTLAETPHFSRHCHLVPAGKSGPKPTVQIRSSHTRRRHPCQLDPSEASVPTQPSPAQTIRTPGRRTSGPRRPIAKVGDSKVTLRTQQQAPEGGRSSFFLHLPGTSRRLGTY